MTQVTKKKYIFLFIFLSTLKVVFVCALKFHKTSVRKAVNTHEAMSPQKRLCLLKLEHTLLFVPKHTEIFCYLSDGKRWAINIILYN